MKVIKMPSWMAWVQRPSGKFKVEESASALKRSYLVKGKECCIKVNINNPFKLLWDITYIN